MVVYILNILISCIILDKIKNRRDAIRDIGIGTVIFIWTIIIGGQWYVGTDYGNYYAFFKNPDRTDFELLFTLISKGLYLVGIRGQGQFFFYAFLNAIVIFKAANRLGIHHLAIFYYLLVAVSTFFNNQMNIIRQCIACAFVFWAFVELYRSKIKGIFLILIAMGFHTSAIVCLSMLFLVKTTNFFTKYPRGLLIVASVILMLPIDPEIIINNIFGLLPESFNEYTYYVARYNSNEYGLQNINNINILSKLILIPVYWLSLCVLDGQELSDKEKTFFKLGFLCFCIKIIFLINPLLSRLASYTWIPSILPIYYLVRLFYRKRKFSTAILLMLYCSATYYVKIIMGIGEYGYDFYLFN